MHRLYKRDSFEVLTHCDPRRSVRACLLARSVPPYIPVLCAVNGSLAEVSERLGATPLPANLIFIPTPRRNVYPANLLRNVALDAATEDWVFYVDCDFVFCEGFWESLSLTCENLSASDDRICLCPVSLWNPEGNAYLNGVASPDIVDEETTETHNPPRTWSEAAGARLFKYHHRYFTAKFGPHAPTYDLTDQMRRLRYTLTPAEPWGLLRRDRVPWADEDFGSGPLDKQQLVSAILDRGTRFVAVPNVFIFHLWHPDTAVGWPDRVRNVTLWTKRHLFRARQYLLIGIGGLLPPFLQDALTVDIESAGSNTSDALVRCPGATGPRISPDESTAGVPCLARHRSPVVQGPCLTRDLFRDGYTPCVFFHSPAFYRRQTLSQQLANGSTDDGWYIGLVCKTQRMGDALALLENVAVFCDVRNAETCARRLANLTGVPISRQEMEQWCGGLPTSDPAFEFKDRVMHPLDYMFYDHLRALAY